MEKKLRKSASSGAHKFSSIYAITTQGKAAIYDNDMCSHFELELLTWTWMTMLRHLWAPPGLIDWLVRFIVFVKQGSKTMELPI